MKAIFILLLTLLLTLASVDADARSVLLFDVRFQGYTVINGNQFPFDRMGHLLAFVPAMNDDPKAETGTHIVDGVLVLGDPTGLSTNVMAGYPPNGDFEFATNTVWYALRYNDSGWMGIDIAYESFDGQCAVLRPDPNRLTPPENQIVNTFSGGGNTQLIQQGDITLCSQDGWNTFSGRIEVAGPRPAGPVEGYFANVQGQIHSTGEVGW